MTKRQSLLRIKTGWKFLLSCADRQTDPSKAVVTLTKARARSLGFLHTYQNTTRYLALLHGVTKRELSFALRSGKHV
jgi:hypothetical protein